MSEESPRVQSSQAFFEHGNRHAPGRVPEIQSLENRMSFFYPQGVIEYFLPKIWTTTGPPVDKKTTSFVTFTNYP